MSLDAFKRLNEEVFVSENPVTYISPAQIEALKKLASTNARNRVRINAHKTTDDPLHEMVIVHKKGMYCQPHKHMNKSESFHMIEGELLLILFDDNGQILQTLDLGAAGTGKNLFYRLSKPLYHMIIPETEFVIFHEVTNGPFRRQETIYAEWAPSEEDDKKSQQEYLSNVLRSMERL